MQQIKYLQIFLNKKLDKYFFFVYNKYVEIKRTVGERKMKKLLIILSILFIGLMMLNDYKTSLNDPPTFTDEQNYEICIEEGI